MSSVFIIIEAYRGLDRVTLLDATLPAIHSGRFGVIHSVDMYICDSDNLSLHVHVNTQSSVPALPQDVPELVS